MKITSLAPFLTLLLLWGCGGAGLGPPAASPAAQPASQHAAPPPATVNWTNFGFTSGHDGFNTKETTIGTGNVSSLTTQWIAAQWTGRANFVKVGNVLYHEADVSATPTLYAYDVVKQQVLWKATVGNNTDNPHGIAYASGLVFAVPCSVGSAGYGVCAFNARTGAKVWGDGFYSVRTAPVVSRGIVYVGYGDSYMISQHIAALSASTGSQVWVWGGCYKVNDCTEVTGNTTPAVDGGKVYFECAGNAIFSNGQGVCAVNVADGSLAWAFNTAPEPAISAAGGYVYVDGQCGSSGSEILYSLAETTGMPRWSYNAGTEGCGLTGPPAIAKGLVYFTPASAGGTLIALHTGTGKVAWTIPPSGSVLSAPTVANGVLYIDSHTPNAAVAAYNAVTGAALWTSKEAWGSNTDDGVNAPIVLNGQVFAYCNGPDVCEYALPAGTKRHEH
ncbi:MAG: PQQ-binding-like beta-propeller repeat protein [Candidatus Eremiobacteraeota bacterium]|nr:PQQ-binding-like beta-propeller repeat protein [Candidatus Eremiobacteraeota bacterium]MBV9699074.1 PQQ-binding-like beta-propeller repeat protein [Candidatus Eremiobacteraeota bacterium]